MLYECNICNKQFKQKSHYIYHLNRIRPCVKNSFKKQEVNDLLNILLERNSILLSKIEELIKRIDKLENEKITETNNNTHIKGVSYKCKNCCKEFKQKCHYINHLHKKNPCVKNSFKKQEDNDLLNIPLEQNSTLLSVITETSNDTIIKRNKCLFKDCSKIPTYNLSDQKKALYCLEHKKENMINIKDKKCIYNDCMKIPTYNLPDQIIPLYCSEHKKENMINVKSKRCIYNGCMKQPVFNLANETKVLYCFEHKKENMINIKDKKCIYNGCMKIPTYNLQYETKALYCFEHKKENMINIKSKMCIHEGCMKIPTYNLQYETKALYCSEHKKENMINVKYKKLCKYCDIKEESKYICNDCKNIKNKKEWSIVRYLRKEIKTNFEYNSSKMLQGCSKKRPDIYFELDKHCLIVEIDENQHNTYEDSCECSRINEIVNGIGGKSIIIIRYNPDIIKNKGKIIEIKQEERINLLVKSIKEELAKDYEQFIVKIIQLYYDDNYEEYKKVKEEEITKLVCI